MKALILIIFAAITLSSSFAGPEQPILAKVVKALEPVLSDLSPAATIVYPESTSSVIISFLPQRFMVHSRSMTGKVADEAEETTGPSFKGFVLKIHLQDKGESNQAQTPQTLQEPYWRTDLDVAEIVGTPNQIYWGLSYGSQTDLKVLTRIRGTLQGLKK